MKNPQPAPADTIIPKQRKHPKIAWPIVATAAPIIIAAIGYFVILPAHQISEYEKDAAPKHQQVNDKLLKVYDSFKRGAFTSADSTPENDKLDVQAARAAVKDAQSTLTANAPAMTKFSAHPLLSWNKSYKQMAATDAAEENYIKQSRAFLGDYTVLLDYTDKSDDIGIKMAATLKDLDSAGGQSSPAILANMIDADVAKLKPLLDEYKALKPPTYLKANTDAAIQALNQLIATLQDVSTGARTLNLTKLNQASSDADHEEAAFESVGKDFVDILQHKSPLQSEISKLRDLNVTITTSYGLHAALAAKTPAPTTAASPATTLAPTTSPSPPAAPKASTATAAPAATTAGPALIPLFITGANASPSKIVCDQSGVHVDFQSLAVYPKAASTGGNATAYLEFKNGGRTSSQTVYVAPRAPLSNPSYIAASESHHDYPFSSGMDVNDIAYRVQVTSPNSYTTIWLPISLSYACPGFAS